MKDDELAKLTNELSNIARLYGKTQQCKGRISSCLKRYLKKDSTAGLFKGIRAISNQESKKIEVEVIPDIEESVRKTMRMKFNGL